MATKAIAGDIWLRLVIPLTIIAVASISINEVIKAGGFFMNLSTELIGIIITVAYVDWIIRRQKLEEWRGTKFRVKNRVQVFVTGLITNIRTGLGFGIDIMDQDEFLTGDNERTSREVRRVGVNVLAPSARSRLDILDEIGWKRLATNLQGSWNEAERLIDRFRDHLEPRQFELTMDIQKAIESALLFWRTFPDIAGVNGDKMPKSRTPPEQIKSFGHESTAEELKKIISYADELGASSAEKANVIV
ncbi:hypothetical protein ACFL5M_03080 [Candidatus Neomarinimicrobiota bacterium]